MPSHCLRPASSKITTRVKNIASIPKRVNKSIEHEQVISFIKRALISAHSNWRYLELSVCEQWFIVSEAILIEICLKALYIITSLEHGTLSLDDPLVDLLALVIVGLYSCLEGMHEAPDFSGYPHVCIMLILIMEQSKSNDFLDHSLHLVDLSEFAHQ